MTPPLRATLDLAHADPVSAKAVAGWMVELSGVGEADAPGLVAALTQLLIGAASQGEGRVTLGLSVQGAQAQVQLTLPSGAPAPQDAPGLVRRAPDAGDADQVLRFTLGLLTPRGG